jgi:uncharacterized protein YbjT (DUF2867 family)
MPKLVLVTGATGYVATRLIPELLARGYQVRCLVRSPGKLRNRPWAKQVVVVQGDVLDIQSLHRAMAGVHSAYYLVHNMSGGQSYRDMEKMGALNFGEACRDAGVQRIVYLGGLGGSEKHQHMHSRQEAGRILRQSGVPAIELRASVVIGSGSISFEMIRSITSWFPFIPAPRETHYLSQPIGISDLLKILIASLELGDISGGIYEIGGPQKIIYPDLMVEYARQKNLIRPKVFIPFYLTGLSAWIADKLTPVPFSIAYPLMEELTAPSVVNSENGAELLLGEEEIQLYVENVSYAMARKEYLLKSPWTASLVTRASLNKPLVNTLGEGFLIDYREQAIANPSPHLKDVLKGQIESDWEVEEPGAEYWIRLRKKQTAFGVLRMEIQYTDGLLMQTSLYEPNGIPGLLWWFGFLKFHQHYFKTMFERLVRASL